MPRARNAAACSCRRPHRTGPEAVVNPSDLLIPKHYQREHLVRARALGAGLVGACDEGEVPRSDLHWIITSLGHNVARKTRIALDMLDVFEFDLSLVW